MPYRETERTRQKRAERSASILDAAFQLTSEGGFASASIAAIAERAGVATGSVYRYFPNKAELCSEVFRMASSRELERVAQALRGDGQPGERLEDAASSFAQRAFRGRQLAYALIAEPVDPLVEADRLEFRTEYARLFAGVIEDGIAKGLFPAQSAELSSAAIVGALAESLVGPLSNALVDSHTPEQRETWVRELAAFCLRAVGGRTPTRTGKAAAGLSE